MERRKFIIGLGSLTAGGAAAMGTGAFSTAWTNRNVEAQIAVDSSAYLGLEDQSEYALLDGNKLALNFAGGTPGQNGDGLNEDANTRFFNVFSIRNNGTNDVSITASDNPDVADQWDSSGFVLYWSADEVDESGGAGLANRDALHDVDDISDPSGVGPNRVIPRIGPGERIWVHPAFFLGPTTGDNTLADDVPNQIGFYVTRTNIS